MVFEELASCGCADLPRITDADTKRKSSHEACLRCFYLNIYRHVTYFEFDSTDDFDAPSCLHNLDSSSGAQSCAFEAVFIEGFEWREKAGYGLMLGRVQPLQLLRLKIETCFTPRFKRRMPPQGFSLANHHSNEMSRVVVNSRLDIFTMMTKSILLSVKKARLPKFHPKCSFSE